MRRILGVGAGLAVIAIVLWWRSEEGAAVGDEPPISPATNPGKSTSSTARDERADPARAAEEPRVAPHVTADSGAAGGGMEDVAAIADGGGSDGAAATAVKQWLEKNAALAEKYVDQFCEESKQMKRAPPGPAPTKKKDASSFLTVRIDWEGGNRAPGLLHLPDALRQRLSSYGADWPRAVTEADLEGLDFSWMTQLHQYDHWNIMAEGPLREDRTKDFYRAPIPNFVEMLHWVKLRLARALRVHDHEQASADIHQLVALLRSMGLVIADMIAVQMLQLERAALEGVAPSLVYSSEELGHERRVGRSAMYFLQPGVKEATMRKAMECNPHFKCAALAEGLGSHVTLAPFSDAQTLGAVKSMVEAAGCASELTQWISQAGPRTAVEARDAVVDPDGSALERMLGGNTPR